MTTPRLSIVPSRAVSDKELSHSAFRTLSALCIHTDENGWCYPRLKVLGKILGKSPQAVSKDIQSLKELGYVNVTPQKRNDGSQGSNLYQVRLDYPPQRKIETPQRKIETPQPNEIETPSTPDVEPLNDTFNDPFKKGEGKPSRASSSDERLKHPAIVGYRALARLQVPIAWRDDVITAVTDDPARVQAWCELVKTWVGKHYNPGNIVGMLEAFANGGLKNGNGKPYQQDEQRLPKGV